jgi:hypothetical protein
VPGTTPDPLHPVHDAVPADPLPVTVVAEWETGTFLENLAHAPDGGWWVTSPHHCRVEQVGADGVVRHSVRFPGPVTGIVADLADEHQALVAGADPDHGSWTLYQISDGVAVPLCPLPGVAFANGMTWYGTQLVIADSTRGALVAVDPRSGRVDIVREDELLAPANPQLPLPGVNGLTVDASGDLLLTNTSRSQLLRLHGGLADGALTVAADRLVGDDLAAHPDGNVYIATHTYHSVLRLDVDGNRSDVATYTQGVAGPTAVALAPDRMSLFVCTTGGLLSPAAGAPEPARLLRIDLRAARDDDSWI